MVNNYLKPRLGEISNPKIIMLCLEEAELFRENSLLLSIMNNSIYSTIKNSNIY
jgi:hypothetical protein